MIPALLFVVFLIWWRTIILQVKFEDSSELKKEVEGSFDGGVIFSVKIKDFLK